MIKAILIDDETINIQNLQALLTRHCPDVEIVGTAQHVDDALRLIPELQPDVIFLDIEMPEQSGFDLLRAIPDAPFEVVFVTAFDAYGIQAIKFSALDYLLKPINTTELKNAVTRVKQVVGLKKENARVQHLLQLLNKNISLENQKIALPTQKETYLVAVKDIVRCESDNNYTSFYLTDGQSHLISKPLYEYDELLSPYGFIRCHQSHLVNKVHVRSILNEDSGYLLLHHSDKKVPISKQKKALVKAKLAT